VTEPLRSELIRYLGEVCILFSDRLGASAVSQSVDGRRGGQGLPGGSRSVKVVGVCGIESERCNQRWGVGIYCRMT
jgi:hypothetical protein